ncbi:SDR family oxidoreductase [Pseudarthrobacter sp. J64]|uniref:SDR family oxidoreductase n=1 Tax=Pseudarthrobacter sp. J64 TaxID=3116485 RepID=UPI002E81A38F|nr:SDR family oxidoreductase [Pseudarthrobacter sp. J64]MEE2570418.1 SDR family oxidoreductase [Pseudarthrobacter sp. J64]
MTELPALAITGATGSIGGGVARELSDAGTSLRLVVRNPARAPELPGAAVVVASYGDGAASAAALDGVQTLLMVSAAEAEDRRQQHFAFVDAAAAAGVQHIVYTSFYGAAPDATFTLARDHYATEEHIKASGMAYTFLRDNFYVDFLPHLAGQDGVIRGPAGDGLLSAVAREDVSRCAAAVLRDPDVHAGKTYNLTGPEEFTLGQAAGIITARTGRTVTYHPETVEEAYASRASYGAPDWQLDAWVSTYTAIAAGEMSGISPDVYGLTGRNPLSLEEFLERPQL